MSNPDVINNNQPVTDSIDIEGKSASTLSISAAAAETPTLPGGLYDLWATVTCYTKLGAGTVTDVTTTNGYRITSGNTVTHQVRQGSKIGCIADGNGTLSYHKVG